MTDFRKDSALAADIGTFDVQVRGVWHRPNSSGTETTLEGICRVLDIFSEADINTVFLETFYHGMTIFKTNRIPYYTGFENYVYGDYPDYLTAFAAEAEARGIEVHCWVEDFYIGVNEKCMLALYHPDWLLLSQSGSKHQSEGSAYGGYIFLDPSNVDVCDYLIEFYDELLSKVPQVKGLNLDYIRYPVSSATDDAGFTQCAMSLFAEKYSLSASDVETPQSFVNCLNANDLQAQWTQFRADVVTNFVRKVFEMVKSKHPEVLISTAIFPDADEAYNTKKQDFSAWLQNGYLDIVTPMVYYYTAAQVGEAVEKMAAQCSDCFCYTGLYTTYHKQSESELAQQIKASNEAGADGFVLFDSSKTFFENDYGSFLKVNYGKTTSNVFPHSSSRLLLQSLSDNLSLYLSSEVAAERENADKVNALLQNISQTMQLGEGDPDSLSQTISQISALSLNIAEYISQDNADKVSASLDKVARFLKVRLARLTAKELWSDEPDDDEPDDDEPDGGNAETQPSSAESVDAADSSGGKSKANLFAVVSIAFVVLATASAAFALWRKKL